MKFQTLLTVASANLVLASDLLAKTADSWIRNNQETQRAYWYGRAVVYEGIEATVELTKNKTLLAWYRDQMDDVVSPNGTIINYDLTKYSLDNYRIGMNLLYWYKQTGEEKYKVAADFIRDRINQHPRTPTVDC
uniref:Uncharacterized protein n=1 Tax=Fusarium oxysporum (strain Fo5176) TaxID=660025 RepID=A0A0D2YHA8_FUSOF